MNLMETFNLIANNILKIFGFLLVFGGLVYLFLSIAKADKKRIFGVLMFIWFCIIVFLNE